MLVFGAQGNPNFSSIVLDVAIETDADEADFATLASEVERRCPLTQLYARSGVRVVNNWRHLQLAEAG